MATPNSIDTKSDRRQFPRTKLAEIAYIGMGPENGGLVLDVSDGGLSFHSVAPVQQAETIRFLLSLRGHSRIEGAGEVMWTNPMRTVCGLRFTSLSSGAREYLNNWTNQSKMPGAPQETPVPTSASADPEVAAERVAAAHRSYSQLRSMFALSTDEEFSMPELEGRPFRQTPLFLWILCGVLGSVLSVIAFFYGVHVGKSQTVSGVRAAVESSAQTESPSGAPGSVVAPPFTAEAPDPSAVAPSSPTVANSAPSEAMSLPNARPARAAAVSIPNVAPSAPGNAVLNASKTEDTTASKPPLPAGQKHSAAGSDSRNQHEAGNAELAAALSYLNGDNGQRDSAKAVQQLWAAVKNGNAKAEVILSDLYVTGDGVAKNCEQARVLLNAATKSGSPEAKVKLDELDSSGCQ